jgi:ABC-type amino acid transport substrate-binding protein
LGAVALWVLLRTPPKAEDATWERILESGVLRVCTDPSWPPFEYTSEVSGRIEGFDADLAVALAERLAPHVRAEMVTAGFDGLYDALLTERCDLVLSALPYEPMRTQDVAYSMAYFDAGLVLVTPEDETSIAGLQDLADRVVGVEWGFVPEGDSQYRLFFRDLGLRRYGMADDALRALQSGEVEAVLVDRISALAFVRDCTGLQIVGEPITNVSYVIPMRLDSLRLQEEVDRVLLEVREDGTLEALQETWFWGQRNRPESKDPGRSPMWG